MRQNKVPLHYYPIHRRTVYQKIQRYFFGDRHVLDPVRRFRPELVVIGQAGCMDGVWWATQMQRLGIPFVTISQAVRGDSWPGDNISNQVIASYSTALNNFFVSHGNLCLFREQLGHHLQPASVVFNPCKATHSNQIPWPTKQDPLRLAYVARLDPNSKGQDLLFKVLSKNKWKTRNVRFDLFGEGNCRNGLIRLAQMLKIDDIVTFCGQQDDPAEIWKDRHGLILPSRSEGFSLAVMEAMLLGRVVITSRVGDNDRIITDGENGFLCDSHSLEALDVTLENAWNRRLQWQAIAERAAVTARNYLPQDPVGFFIDRLFASTGSNVTRKQAAA